MTAQLATLLEPVAHEGPLTTIVDGKYEISRALGRGANGVVFEARHVFTGRTVALKMLPPDAPPYANGYLTARLLRESRALAAVDHPCVVSILDAGTTVQGPYMALEMLRGRTLDSLVAARGRLDRDDAIAVALQLSAALAASHDADIIHRDVKPGNVFVSYQAGVERMKLIDFGIAQVCGTFEPKLTSTGVVLGTPAYMAPEQLLGDLPVDARADVYALGATFFECLTGRLPFGDDFHEVLRSAGFGGSAPSVLLFCPEAGEEVAAVVARAIARDPESRFRTVDAFADALRAAAPLVRPTTSLLRPKGGLDFEARRRRPRAPYATPALVLTPYTGFDAKVADISAGGLLLLSRHDLALHDRIRVRFALPLTRELVTLTAEVRWVSPNRQVSDRARPTGLELIDVPAPVQEEIESFVELMNDWSSEAPRSGVRIVPRGRGPGDRHVSSFSSRRPAAP